MNKHSSDGRDSLRTGIKELERAGYIHRTRRRNEKGQLREYEYEVFEQPNPTLLIITILIIIILIMRQATRHKSFS